MGGIGYALGSILQGAGEGLEKQTILNEDNRQKTSLVELQARRDAALEALRHGYRVQEQNNESANIDTRDANSQARKFAYGTKETEQKQGFEQSNIILKGKVDLQSETYLKSLQHKYNLTEDAAKAGQQLDHDLKVAGITADHWAVTTDGKMVAFNKKGEVLHYSANPDSFIPSGKSESDDGDGATIAGERTTRGSATPAEPKAKPTGQLPDQKRIKGDALARLGTVYAEISANPGAKTQYQRQYPGMFDANGNLLPKDALIQRVNQRYGG